jgi:hypothetical protein
MLLIKAKFNKKERVHLRIFYETSNDEKQRSINWLKVD